ncbi:uncharacterized protein [Rutidosis leptorrhynchoides]|uniref:uncharacterized protein isoform X2 n=1 Tax=Rutidosis leptorrhynchoides TaxID=125765 RepID=UPI003A996A52
MMSYLTMDCWYLIKKLPSSPYLQGKKHERPCFQYSLPTKSLKGFRANTTVYASKSSPKKLRKLKETKRKLNPQLTEGPLDEQNEVSDKISSTDSVNNLESRASVAIASRSSVLQACTVTSSIIAVAGLLIRQGSHLASSQGWSVADCSSEISFDFETWHLQLIAGLVILISSSRFILLNTWSDFAESSETSNQQVLTSLEPLDYAFVAFLPGISEELLFRGALLPLCGINLTSATAVAALFGILHLGSGLRLLGLLMGTQQYYPLAFWCRWLRMQLTT